jgi:hypothetical protein
MRPIVLNDPTEDKSVDTQGTVFMIRVQLTVFDQFRMHHVKIY